MKHFRETIKRLPGWRDVTIGAAKHGMLVLQNSKCFFSQTKVYGDLGNSFDNNF